MSGIARGTYPVILSASQSITANTTGKTIVVPDGFTRVLVVLDITAKSGTSPTLNCYVQSVITFPAATDLVAAVPTGNSTFNDIISFAQATTVSTQYASLIETSGFMNAAQDAALAAGSIRAGVLSNCWRVKFVTGGSSPSFTCSVFAKFLP